MKKIARFEDAYCSSELLLIVSLPQNKILSSMSIIQAKQCSRKKAAAMQN